jgi:hypothetical protein
MRAGGAAMQLIADWLKQPACPSTRRDLLKSALIFGPFQTRPISIWRSWVKQHHEDPRHLGPAKNAAPTVQSI